MTLQSNIWKLFLWKFFRYLMFGIPIVVIFYQSLGLDLTEIFILHSIFSLSIVVFEIPTGYFADVYGRRNSIALGALFAVIGYLFLAAAQGFWSVATSAVVMALALGLTSGSDSALLYDTLLELKREKEYKKQQGRLYAAFNFAEGIAAFFAGFLAVVSLRLPLYVQAAFVSVSFFMALTLQEPSKHKRIGKEASMRDLLRIVHFSLVEHKQLKWLILYSSLLSSGGLVMVWFIQPYFTLIDIPLALFGVIWSGLNVSLGMFALLGHHVEEYLGRKNSLIFLLVLLVVGFVSVSLLQNVWGIAFLLLFYLLRGIKEPLVKDYINKLVRSRERATVLSVHSMTLRFLFALAGPVAGFVADVYTLPMALLSSGITFGVIGVVFLFMLKKHDGF